MQLNTAGMREQSVVVGGKAELTWSEFQSYSGE